MRYFSRLIFLYVLLYVYVEHHDIMHPAFAVRVIAIEGPICGMPAHVTLLA